MISRHAAILQAILQLGQCWTDRLHEPYIDWQVRADMIAEAIDTVSRNNEEAAFLAYMGKHESGFAREIQVGHEEAVRKGKRYWSMWQIDVGAIGALKVIELLGDDPSKDTETFARIALSIYRLHRGTGTLVDGVRGYGGYKRWSPTPRILAGRIRRIERKLDQLTTEKEQAGDGTSNH